MAPVVLARKMKFYALYKLSFLILDDADSYRPAQRGGYNPRAFDEISLKEDRSLWNLEIHWRVETPFFVLQCLC